MKRGHVLVAAGVLVTNSFGFVLLCKGVAQVAGAGWSEPAGGMVAVLGIVVGVVTAGVYLMLAMGHHDRG